MEQVRVLQYATATPLAITPRRPGKFDFPATHRGSTTHFHIYYDPALGQAGAAVADGVLAVCDRDYDKISAIFGGLSAGPFSLILASNPGGAYHHGCAATDLYCDTRLSPPDPAFSSFLNVAEFVEVFSAVQGKGWDCGQANGEGLSRVLATMLYPAELGRFATAAAWLDSPRANFVDNNGRTDTDPIANGCAVLFLNYMARQLNFTWNQIIAAAAPTLGQTYTVLTAKTDGFAGFSALLQAHYPLGRPSSVTTDDPFPL